MPHGHRGPIALIAAVALLLVLAPSALGHAELETAVPADGSVLTESPTEIVLTFTEALTASKSSIELVNSSGATIAQGGAVDPKSPKTMRLALASALPVGAYEILWTSVSAVDGDVAHGTPKFTIVAPSPSPTEQPSATPGESAATSGTPSATPSASPAPSPSVTPAAPAASTSDALIPIAVALIVLALLGAWLLRSRGRRSSP